MGVLANIFYGNILGLWVQMREDDFGKGEGQDLQQQSPKSQDLFNFGPTQGQGLLQS